MKCPAVTGCIDFDLNFSQSTNLLPIRRLREAVGADARVLAAWLRFVSFALEPLDQVYRRTGDDAYRYESGGGQFVPELRVYPVGFVTTTLAGGRPSRSVDPPADRFAVRDNYRTGLD